MSQPKLLDTPLYASCTKTISVVSTKNAPRTVLSTCAAAISAAWTCVT
jgi:hypothetical protein